MTERIIRTNSLNDFRLFFNRVSVEVGDISKLVSASNTTEFDGDNSTTDFVLLNIVYTSDDDFVVVVDGDQKYSETDFNISDNGTDTTIAFFVAPPTGTDNVQVFKSIVDVLSDLDARIISNDNDIDQINIDIGLNTYNVANSTSHVSIGIALDTVETDLEIDIGLANYAGPNAGGATDIGQIIDNIDDFYDGHLGAIEDRDFIKTWDSATYETGDLVAQLNYLDDSVIGDTQLLNDWDTPPSNMIDALEQLWTASLLNPADPVSSKFLIKNELAGDTMVGPFVIDRGANYSGNSAYSLEIINDNDDTSDAESQIKLATGVAGATNWILGTSGDDLAITRGHGTGDFNVFGNRVLTTGDESKYFRTDQANTDNLDFTFANGRGISLGTSYSDHASAETDGTYGGSLTGTSQNNRYLVTPGSVVIKNGTDVLFELANDGSFHTSNADGTLKLDIDDEFTFESTKNQIYSKVINANTAATVQTYRSSSSTVHGGECFTRHTFTETNAYTLFNTIPSASQTGVSKFYWHLDNTSQGGNFHELMRLEQSSAAGKLLFNGISIDGNNSQISATQFNGYLNGNAFSAAKLATARTISVTGSTTATGVNFDGTSNISLDTTISLPVKVYDETGTLIWDQNQ